MFIHTSPALTRSTISLLRTNHSWTHIHEVDYGCEWEIRQNDITGDFWNFYPLNVNRDFFLKTKTRNINMRVRNGRDSLKAKHGYKTANGECGSRRDGQEKNDRPERPLRMCVGRVLRTLEVDCSRHSVSVYETQIYGGTQISQITQIFSHLKLWIAVARHNFR